MIVFNLAVYLAFFDNFFRILAIFKQCLVTLVVTLSNSKAKLLSSAVSSQLIVSSLLLIRGRDKIKIKMEIDFKKMLKRCALWYQISLDCGCSKISKFFVEGTNTALETGLKTSKPQNSVFYKFKNCLFCLKKIEAWRNFRDFLKSSHWPQSSLKTVL
jgi:hypothetical protein